MACQAQGRPEIGQKPEIARSSSGSSVHAQHSGHLERRSSRFLRRRRFEGQPRELNRRHRLDACGFVAARRRASPPRRRRRITVHGSTRRSLGSSGELDTRRFSSLCGIETRARDVTSLVLGAGAHRDNDLSPRRARRRSSCRRPSGCHPGSRRTASDAVHLGKPCLGETADADERSPTAGDASRYVT